MKITKDSRKYGRVSARGLLKYASDLHSSDFQVMNIKEISAGGLSFLATHKIEPGSKLKISLLLLPREEPMEINTEVLHCLQKRKKPPTYHIGVCFQNMPEKDQAVLHNALIELAKNKKGDRPPHFVIRLHNH